MSTFSTVSRAEEKKDVDPKHDSAKAEADASSDAKTSVPEPKSDKPVTGDNRSPRERSLAAFSDVFKKLADVNVDKLIALTNALAKPQKLTGDRFNSLVDDLKEIGKTPAETKTIGDLLKKVFKDNGEELAENPQSEVHDIALAQLAEKLRGPKKEDPPKKDGDPTKKAGEAKAEDPTKKADPSKGDPAKAAEEAAKKAVADFAKLGADVNKALNEAKNDGAGLGAIPQPPAEQPSGEGQGQGGQPPSDSGTPPPSSGAGKTPKSKDDKPTPEKNKKEDTRSASTDTAEKRPERTSTPSVPESSSTPTPRNTPIAAATSTPATESSISQPASPVADAVDAPRGIARAPREEQPSTPIDQLIAGNSDSSSANALVDNSGGSNANAFGSGSSSAKPSSGGGAGDLAPLPVSKGPTSSGGGNYNYEKIGGAFYGESSGDSSDAGMIASGYEDFSAAPSKRATPAEQVLSFQLTPSAKAGSASAGRQITGAAARSVKVPSPFLALPTLQQTCKGPLGPKIYACKGVAL